jgi:alkylhydroperoxidase family enzyme
LGEDTIADVLTPDTAGLPSHHRAALALADAMMTQPTSLPDEALAELREHFTPEQLIELTLDIMKWNYQKTAVALGVDEPVRTDQLSDLVFDEAGNWVR